MITTERVSMMDLAYQHRFIEAAVAEGFARVLATSSFIQGPDVSEFEEEFARYCGVDHVVGVGNGTDALELALRGSGIGSGDEVIVPANTFVATAEAVVRAGADLVLVDCGPDFLIDPSRVADRLTPRTRAIMAVHLYGQTAAIDDLRSVAGSSVSVIEDAAQAQGARYRGLRAGSLGDVAGTSFYPGKNLGAYGDGGAVLTSSEEIAARVRAIGNHGGTKRYEHLIVGMNSRLDSLQAVVLSAKLAFLDSWNDERRAIARRYDERLAECERVVTPISHPENEHVYHQYVVQIPDRDRIVAELLDDGIGVGIHYPAPVHLLPAFSWMAPSRDAFPVAEQLATRIVSLPIYPGLGESAQDRVIESLLARL
jgi:dTDP-4-amino-4,6-dideoxygalactose transaminase